MILPTKGVSADQALLTVGSEILSELEESQTTSGLWYRVMRRRTGSALPLSFDWFVLALDFLFMVGLVEVASGGMLRRVAVTA